MNPIHEAERAVLVALARRFPDSFVWTGGSLLQLHEQSPRASLDVDLIPSGAPVDASEFAEAVAEALGALNAILGSQFESSIAEEGRGLLRLRIHEAETDAAFTVDVTRIAGAGGRTRSVLVNSLLGTAAVNAPGVSTLLRQKARALLFRRFAKAGDIFDIWFLLQRGAKLEDNDRLALQDELLAAGIDEETVEERFAVLSRLTWVPALTKSGVGGLNRETAVQILVSVRAFVETLLP